MMRILVVEDDRDQRTLLAEELGAIAPLVFAESGQDALSLIEALPAISAVVSDLELGHGPTGFDVLRAARTRHPRCITVLVTGQHSVTLDAATSELIEVVFGKPWVLGTIRLYLMARIV